MPKPVQGYMLLLLEEERNLLGLLLSDVSVPGKYARTFANIQDRFNSMELHAIGSVGAPGPSPGTQPAASKKSRKKKKKVTNGSGKRAAPE